MQYYYLFALTLILCVNFASAFGDAFEVETIAAGLDHPWSIEVASENEILVTEGVGRLRRIVDGELHPEPVTGVPPVLFKSQGALSDVVLHPEFNQNRYLYLSFSEADAENPLLNTLKVVRGKLEGNHLSNVEQIFAARPLRKTAAHYGARVLFLRDGTMLISSGDAFNQREKAQMLDNHFGKVIRLNDDGTIPEDNPFQGIDGALPEIWSYGHRNMQGLALSVDGTTVFEHEHGPKGGDELNILSPGKNYGWPAITYGIDYSGALISPFTEREGMEQPLKYWVPSIAPSGMTFYDGEMFPDWKGNLFISALVPGDVRRLTIVGDDVTYEEILFGELGRVRDIATAPDGSLLLVTDGPEGKVVRISTAVRRVLPSATRN